MMRQERLRYHGVLVTLALFGLFLVPLSSMPAAEAATTTTRVLEITEATADPRVPWRTFDGNPPKVYDINGDGIMEIIAQNDNHWVYIFNSKTGDLVAEVKATIPSGWGARTFNGPEVTILEQGGQVHVVVASSAAVITAYRFDHSASTPQAFAFHKVWETRLNTCFSDAAMDAKVVFADLNRDGKFEILGATEESGLYALRSSDGSIFWRNCLGGGNAEPGVADLNLDGYPDVVHVSDGGTISALNGLTGKWLWSYSVRSAFNLGSGSIPVAPGIGQLDGVGGPDIVIGARDSHDATNWENDHALLLALSSTGKVLWHYQDPVGNPLTYTRPIVADADKNGVNEVYWADWNTVGHKPPPPDSPDAWKVTGPANFYRFDTQGNRVWKTALPTWWHNKDLAIADFDGDGLQEVLANGPNSNGHDGVWYLNVKTGAKEAFVDVYPYKVQRAPIVADLWKTGTAQWVVQVAGAASGAGHAILVYDTHAKYDAVWPHVPYPNIGDSQPDPNPDPDPEPTDFTASFSGVKGNEWWIQTQVSASGGTLAKVDVRLNGGTWKALKNEGWGWAASYHAPQGTIVQLRATSTTGATDLSGCYQWTAATPVTCSQPDPEPDPGTFDARFHGVQGNEWWIQTNVDVTGGTLAKVDVRLNGGSWKALTKHSYGWAASYHAPQGTVVQFRATSTTGATDLSACLRWTDIVRVDCPGGTDPDPDPSGFTATFKNVRGNEWWVESEVTSSGGTLAGVSARVNGGSWVALSKQTWGSWAKSIHAPPGSIVEFRASSTAGEHVLSAKYTWPPA